MVSATTSFTPAQPINPLLPSAAACNSALPPNHDIYVTTPVMVPAPVVYTPPPPPPPHHHHRPSGVGTGVAAGVAAGVATVAVVECCCW